MNSKQGKRERRREREAAREERRRRQRQQTLFTTIVIFVIIGIGGFLIFLSLEDPVPTADQPEEGASEEGITEEAASEPDARPVACGAVAPQSAGMEKPTFPQAEQVTRPGADYQAVIETSCGRVVVDLLETEAPQTVNSFVFLAQQGFFSGLEIFRNATSIGALQTGSGTNDASFDVGYTIPDELQAAQQGGYPPGTVAMANAGPNTGGSQFFFVYNDQFKLPPDYAAFGRVTEGLDVLQRIGAIPAGGDGGETPTEIVYMDSVTIRP